ncbi:exosome complex component RRP45-like isoform X2 [Pomacea canaliculata]|uniref:exosome complex component RRP45-like isoform X2 n=1 Tax=Pomacea canaliculata TaxID=400727 RepID=UPI000D7289F7|nr:exosome complex component RRP45-like isoform X2 [Pomacea canaliculata]
MLSSRTGSNEVSCEVTLPKLRRPTEGILFVNVELSPMASASFEQGRLTEEGVELSRLLERCLKESHCVDLESLCIIAGAKVWSIRVDIHILNHDGNMLDCSSIAAISALAHFRRPDVTVKGEEVTIHTSEERDPIPLSLHHMPLCVSFAFFHQGKYLLVDPGELEERVMDGKMVIGMNKHREICMLQITGQMLLLKEQVLRCSNIAVVKVMEMTELIQEALLNDKSSRAKGLKCGFAESATKRKVNRTWKEAMDVNSVPGCEVPSDSDSESDEDVESKISERGDVNVLGHGVGAIGKSAVSKWFEENTDDMEKELEEERNKSVHTNSSQQEKAMTAVMPADISGDHEGDSEEEAIQILDKDLKLQPMETEQPANQLSKLKQKPDKKSSVSGGKKKRK